MELHGIGNEAINHDRRRDGATHRCIAMVYDADADGDYERRVIELGRKGEPDRGYPCVPPVTAF